MHPYPHTIFPVSFDGKKRVTALSTWPQPKDPWLITKGLFLSPQFCYPTKTPLGQTGQVINTQKALGRTAEGFLLSPCWGCKVLS